MNHRLYIILFYYNICHPPEKDARMDFEKTKKVYVLKKMKKKRRIHPH